MERLRRYFRVLIKENKMIAQLECTEEFFNLEEDIIFDIETWKAFLASNDVTYGLKLEALEDLLISPSRLEYPITIANGQLPIRGTDGKMEFIYDFDESVIRDENWNFREVMRIPSVSKGQKLAIIIKPTSGVDGRDVTGKQVIAVPGESEVIKAGKNVVFREDNNSFYAAEDGQFSILGRRLNVFPVYEVNESLSLKNGNLNFVGTIVIRGDVPTGFTVKAEGDIKIYGKVEGAEIIAGGSIFIAEGISGQGRGYLKADENIRIGYINQAEVQAENNLFVENSIIHSLCIANGHVFCQKGNIIGGSITAGKTIEASDIGTKMNTKTEIILGINKLVSDREQQILKEQQELEELLEKLKLLGKKLTEQDQTNPKVRVSLLRQKNTYNKTYEKLAKIKEELSSINATIGDFTQTKLIVRNFIYQNVIVTFGKYTRIIKSSYYFIQMNTEDNEIALHQLYEPELIK